VLTPDETPDRILELASAAVRGGADIIQLRHKSLARGELLSLVRRLRPLMRGRLLIVNDHVDIAILEADGVHLGPDDLSIASARRIAGSGLLVGASASSPDAARAAVTEGVDYIGCGPAFATPIKTEKAVIGPVGIAAVAAAVGPGVPVFAIGGIDESNLEQVTAAGLQRVCVIRAVSDAADPEAATRRLRAMLTLT
jgi:thiamine-phosphate pyrophosphorylase